MTGDVRAAKDRLRAQVLARRAGTTGSERSAAGDAIAIQIAASWPDVLRVAAYLSVGTEPPTGPLLAALSARRAQVLLPVVTGADLAWAIHDPDLPAAPGPLGINEPTGTRLDGSVLATVDLVVVPALAVDPTGNRLGRGRGYYDRALAEVTCEVVAVVYDQELVDHVPAEPHDRKVDGLVRPSAVSRTC